jgi:hypothetical protein
MKIMQETRIIDDAGIIDVREADPYLCPKRHDRTPSSIPISCSSPKSSVTRFDCEGKEGLSPLQKV